MGKMPINAKCVFKGVLFDVYQWEQKMFDGTTKIFEAIKRKNSVQIIAITVDKKIILLEEEQPHIGKFLSLPGGVIDDNETPRVAAIRELIEETGMACENIIPWKEISFGSKIDWTTYYFIAKKCKKNRELKLDVGEKIKLTTILFEEFLQKIEEEEFRNKGFSDIIFRIKNNKGELEKFKKELFD